MWWSPSFWDEGAHIVQTQQLLSIKQSLPIYYAGFSYFFQDSLKYFTTPLHPAVSVSPLLFCSFFSTSDSRSFFCHLPQNLPHYHALTRIRPLFLSLQLCLNVSSTNPKEKPRAGAAPKLYTLGGGRAGNQPDEAAICTRYFSLLCMPSILFTILGGGGSGAPRGCILRDCSHGIPTLCHSLIGRSWRQDVR